MLIIYTCTLSTRTYNLHVYIIYTSTLSTRAYYLHVYIIYTCILSTRVHYLQVFIICTYLLIDITHPLIPWQWYSAFLRPSYLLYCYKTKNCVVIRFTPRAKPKAEVNNDLFSTRAKPELKTWYYHALLSYVTILATK